MNKAKEKKEKWYNDYRTCPICRKIHRTKNATLQQLGKYKRIKCNTCGGIYITPLNFPLPIYDIRYNNYFKRPSDVGKAGIFAERIAKKLDSPKYRNTFLDIGPGNAFLPWLLREMGYDVTVLDYCENWCEHLKDNYDLRVINSSIESWKVSEKFDYIHCSHVLEHLKDPLSAFKNLKEMMGKNSTLFISMPDTYYLNYKTMDWKHLKTRNKFEHCSLMEYRTIIAIAKDVGLKIEEFDRLEEYQSMEITLTL